MTIAVSPQRCFLELLHLRSDSQEAERLDSNSLEQAAMGSCKTFLRSGETRSVDVVIQILSSGLPLDAVLRCLCVYTMIVTTAGMIRKEKI